MDNKTQILRKNGTFSSLFMVAVFISDLSSGSNVPVSFSCDKLEVVLHIVFISPVVVCEIFHI